MMFNKEGFEEMYKIVLSFISRPESNAFRDPVDWKHLGLLDYPSIVKHPMDLGVMSYIIYHYDHYQWINHPATIICTTIFNTVTIIAMIISISYLSGTIKKRMESDVYDTVEDVARDMR